MFTYVCLGTNDLTRASLFYDATLAALGLQRCITGDPDWDQNVAGSEGGPGLRPQYNPDFYAAYVRDPDGNKLAAVCRGFTEPQ